MRGRRASGSGWTCPDCATFCFDERSDHVVAAPHPGVAADAVAELYWHSALPLVVQARGGEVLHASGVLMRARRGRPLRGLEEREVHHRLRSPPARLPPVGRRCRRPRGDGARDHGIAPAVRRASAAGDRGALRPGRAGGAARGPGRPGRVGGTGAGAARGRLYPRARGAELRDDRAAQGVGGAIPRFSRMPTASAWRTRRASG